MGASGVCLAARIIEPPLSQQQQQPGVFAQLVQILLDLGIPSS